MSEPIKVSTQKYIKNGNVEIDGHLWTVSLPGAGTDLRFSQASRACRLYEARLELIDKKIDAGTATDEDLDRYEEYSELFEKNEKIVYEIFSSSFRDKTPDNSEVKKWMNDTPMAVIMLAFDDVKEQANSEDEASGKDQPAEPEAKPEKA